MRQLALVTVSLCLAAASLPAQEVCRVQRPTASFVIHQRADGPTLSTDPHSRLWKTASSASILKDCTHVVDYPDIRSEVRGFWTATDLYLLFQCPYKELNLFLPAKGGGPRDKLWDRDVVEMFLGDDWTRI